MNRVCRAESLSPLIPALLVKPAAVSRAIGRLEERLKVRLFVRSTRKIARTEGGSAYFEQCRRALSQLQEAESELTGRQAEPVGLLRISVPTPLGHHRVLPLLPAFHARYPQVQVDVQISNRNIDFIADGFDLALRGREPPDSGLVSRHLMDAQLVVVAEPSYLARAGTPRTLEDLAEHDCIQFVLPSTGMPIPWMFLRDGQELEMVTQGSARVQAWCKRIGSWWKTMCAAARWSRCCKPLAAGAGPFICCTRETGICRCGCGCLWISWCRR